MSANFALLVAQANRAGVAGKVNKNNAAMYQKEQREFQKTMAESKDAKVRLAVASNPHVSKQILNDMFLNETDPEVVKECLKKKSLAGKNVVGWLQKFGGNIPWKEDRPDIEAAFKSRLATDIEEE